MRLDFCSPCFESPPPFFIVHVISWSLDHCPQKDYVNKPHFLLNPERLPVINKHAAHHEVLTFSIISYAEAVWSKSSALISVLFVFFFFFHMAAIGNIEKLQRTRIESHPPPPTL